MCKSNIFLILVLLSGQRFVYAVCPDGEAELHEEARLHEDLTSCSSRYRPVLDYKSTIDVHVRLALKYLTFDNTEEKITVHSWIAIKWKDEYLHWTPSDYSDIKEIQIESTDIWSPPLVLINADASVYQPESIYTMCLLASDGVVTCVPQMSHTAICRTAFRLWPYDEKTCTLYFGSTFHTADQVNYTFYKTRPILLDDFQNAPGWKLLNVFFQRSPGKHSSSNSTYPRLRYEFKLRREAAGMAAIIIVPSVIIVLLTLSSLLLDVKDNTRLGMICFSLLGHFIYITEINYVVPKLSSDTPVILLFIRDSMIVTLVGIMETLFLMYLRRKVESAPTWVVSVNRLVTSGPGKYVVFTEFDPCDNEAAKVITEEDSGNTNDDQTRIHADWIRFANLVNSFIFIVSFVVYLVLMCMKIPTGN